MTARFRRLPFLVGGAGRHRHSRKIRQLCPGSRLERGMVKANGRRCFRDRYDSGLPYFIGLGSFPGSLGRAEFAGAFGGRALRLANSFIPLLRRTPAPSADVGSRDLRQRQT
jgi:hypothetical protein